MSNGNLIDACARLRAEAATDDPGEVAAKIVRLRPLLKDLPVGERMAAMQVLSETIEILDARQADP